ncbi:uncharacterized protein LOC134670846 [Cydia fagiglandana]|uniref:uncharacterized protein LOC134670846 n=1 Tax=Cydia fagiglandana TaxID=1458189 RepID=UPI002FEE5220
MVKCARCNEDVLDVIQCSRCKHYLDYKCAGVTEGGWRKLGERQRQWKCPNCKTAAASGASPAPPTTSSVEPPVVAAKTLTLEHVMEELNKVNGSLAVLSTVASDIKEIRSDISDLRATVNQYATDIKNLDERLTKVEEAHKELPALKSRLLELEECVSDTDQWLRLNNVEIKGVPQKNHENLFDIVSKIGSKIMCPLANPAINFVARVPSRDNSSRDKSIVLSFINRYVKEDFVAAAKQNRTLCPLDLGLEGTGRIYVNDHLTVRNKILLSKTKKLAQEHEYEFKWVKNSKIFVRKNTSSQVIAIKNEKDLLKIR